MAFATTGMTCFARKDRSSRRVSSCGKQFTVGLRKQPACSVLGLFKVVRLKRVGHAYEAGLQAKGSVLNQGGVPDQGVWTANVAG